MALCRVIKETKEWNIGDLIEAYDTRKVELVEHGVIEVIEDDISNVSQEFPKKVIVKRKKGVK